jgi:hypothetical protein
MISAAAYILRVPENRRRILLRDESGTGFYSHLSPIGSADIRTGSFWPWKIVVPADE